MNSVLQFLFTDPVIGLVKGLLVIGVVLQIVPLLIYLERKLSAYMQGRLGPNRVNFVVPYAVPGLGGLRLIPGSLQPLADAIKLAFKEEIIPKDADKLLWYLGPFLAFFPVATALAFIPFGINHWDAFGSGIMVDLRVCSVDISVLLLFAIASLGVYGIAAGGWGSGSKYPLMAAVRASAQMISYEVAMGIAVLAAIATVGSVDLQQFVTHQATNQFADLGLFTLPNWLVFSQPLAALIFLVAMFAENNRLPFDMPECEPELVGGFHTEYSGLKFALFFLGEYAAMILMCSLFTTIFLGGWSSFWGPDAWWVFGWVAVDPYATDGINAILSHLWFMAKVMALLTFQIWIRWTLPRFRYDQLMNLGWKVMVPLALGNLVLTAIACYFLNPIGVGH